MQDAILISQINSYLESLKAFDHAKWIEDDDHAKGDEV